MREIDWPAGTRHKDRDAIRELLQQLESDLNENQLEKVVDLIDLALIAGGRKVPSHVWTHT